MPELYALQPSNSHRTLLPRDHAGWQDVTKDLNRSSLAGGWKAVELELHTFDRSESEVPDIGTIHVPGALAFRAELLDALLPSRERLELLPLIVNSQQWLLVNCLNWVDSYDESKSKVMRGLNGDIFMVLKLILGAGQSAPELFTLTESNRAQLFATDSFKARVERLNLKGITFRRMDGRP